MEILRNRVKKFRMLQKLQPNCLNGNAEKSDEQGLTHEVTYRVTHEVTYDLTHEVTYRVTHEVTYDLTHEVTYRVTH